MSSEWYDYEWMLERAYSLLPPAALHKERFEMPKFKANYIGNRTIVTNFKAVADYLNRDPRHLLKFLLKELAVSGYMEGNRAVLTARIPLLKLNKKLEDYVKEYVLCKECGKPDTKLIKEGRILFLKCTACGAWYPVRPI